MQVYTIDFETFWDQDYTLSKMSTEEYVRDTRFKAHMVGIKKGDEKTVVVPGHLIPAVFARIDWTQAMVLCQHTHFDGFILSHHYGVVPGFYLDTLSMFRALYPAESASLANQTKVLGLPAKGNGYDIVNTKGVQTLNPTDYQKCASYCALDCDLTKRIFDLLKKSFPVSELRLIDLTVRMFTDPVLGLNEPLLQEALEDEIAAKAALLERVAHDKDSLSSNPKFAQILLDLGVDPPKKLSPAKVKRGEINAETEGEAPVGLLNAETKKVWSYAFGKADEAFKRLLEHEDPMVQAIMEARFGVKSTIKETRAQRFIGIAQRGTFPIYLKYYGAHCVTEDVEVLTHKGWKRIGEWVGGEIAQVHPDQTIEFLPADKFAGPVEDEWVSIDAPYLTAQFTKGHTTPYLTHGGLNWKTAQAGDLAKRLSSYIPVGGNLLSAGSITAEQMRVLVMIQADGSYEEATSVGRGLRVFVKKPRKIERARELFNAAGVRFEEQTYASHPEYVRFIVRWADIPEWLSPERKFFGSWLLDSTPEARMAFMDEILFWDGWTQSNQGVYSTSEDVNAEWAVTMAHLNGMSASIYTVPQKGNTRPNHKVAFRKRPHIMVFQHHISSVCAPQKTYCTITQTGFWLARRNGRIFVTGNTGRYGGGDKVNPQNLNKFCPNPECDGGKVGEDECPKCEGTGVSPLRRAIQAPEGHVIVVRDLSAIEARVNAWLAGQDDMVDIFRRGEDIYCDMYQTISGRAITKKDKSERFLGKSVVLGAGYGLGWRKFQGMLRVGMLGDKGRLLGWDIADSLGVNVDGFRHKLIGYIRESLPPGVSEETHALHCACAQKIIQAFRDNKPKIPEMWDTCQKALGWILEGKRERFGTGGIIETCPEGLILPNKMIIRYTELEAKQIGRRVEYSVLKNKRKGEREKLYGGKVVENCLTPDTEVLTLLGWKPIICVTRDDVLWDGEQWVRHKGIIQKGEQDVIDFGGVGITPDHKVWTERGWIEAEETSYGEATSSCERHYRTPTRNAYGNKVPRERRSKIPLVDTLRLWYRKNNGGDGVQQRKDSFLRLQYRSFDGRGPRHAWDEQTSGVRGLSEYDRSLPTTNTSSIQELWCAGYHGLRSLARRVSEFLGRHGADVSERVDARSEEKQRRVFPRKLPVGVFENPEPQPQSEQEYLDSFRRDVGLRSIGSFRDWSNDASLSNRERLAPGTTVRQTRCQKQIVYDIMDSGPHHRFMIRGKDGRSFIVHNCVQALSRIILTDAMLQMKKEGMKVVHQVHDEILVVCKESEAEKVYHRMGTIMSTPPTWAPDLPLASEGGWNKRYIK